MGTGDGGCCGCGEVSRSISLQPRRSDASRRASYPFSSPERLTNHYLAVWSSALFSAVAREFLHHPLFYVAMHPQSEAESPVVSDRYQTTPHDHSSFRHNTLLLSSLNEFSLGHSLNLNGIIQLTDEIIQF